MLLIYWVTIYSQTNFWIVRGQYWVKNSTSLTQMIRKTATRNEEIVLFVADDTASVYARIPEYLVENLQKEVNKSAKWWKDKRFVVAKKKKNNKP